MQMHKVEESHSELWVRIKDDGIEEVIISHDLCISI